jgi:archaellum biogenesis ATPase FlaH
MKKKNFIGFRDRILLHLLKFEKDVYENIHGNKVDGDYRDFLINLTQEGIANGVGTKQSTIYKELKTLYDPGQSNEEPLINIIEKVRIPGRERSCAIYFLTPYGQDLAYQKRSYIEHKNLDVKGHSDETEVITIGKLSDNLITQKITNNPIDAILKISTEVSPEGKIDWSDLLKPPEIAGNIVSKTVPEKKKKEETTHRLTSLDFENPYFNRNAIKDPDYFFGRLEEVKYIFSLLRNAQSCSIVGPRRIGKSSLINYVSDPKVMQSYDLNPDDFIFVPIDLEGLAELTQTDVFSMIIEEIRNRISVEELRRKLENLLAKEQIRFLDLKNILKDISDQNKNVIFLFDEFELITSNKNLDSNFFSGLRNLANTYNVAYITTSNSPLLELTFSRETLGSPFFNFFTQIDLGLMTESEVNDLIMTPLKKLNVDFNDKINNFIKKTAGAHPFFIQIICFHLLNCIKENNAITDDNLKLINQRFTKEVNPHFRYFWGHLSEVEQSTLIEILKNRDSFDFLKNKTYIDRLVRRALLQKTNTGYKVFSIPFSNFIISTANLSEITYEQLDQKQDEPGGECAVDNITPGGIIGELSVGWGNIYFADEDSPNITTEFYSNLLEQGIPGLFITRTHPDKAKETWNLNQSNIIWLCSRSGPGFIRPALEKISHTIFEFINNNKNSVVLLDGVEYIVNNNDFLKTLNLMDNLKEVVAVNKAILIFPISSTIFSEKEMALLRKNSTQLNEPLKLDLNDIIK